MRCACGTSCPAFTWKNTQNITRITANHTVSHCITRIHTIITRNYTVPQPYFTQIGMLMCYFKLHLLRFAVVNKANTA
jgi:hypothetical protein